jgi:hypothetical protein
MSRSIKRNVLQSYSPGTSGRLSYNYDADALGYIQAVEAADGEPLPTAVRFAIRNFVVGCKIDGNWGAIKAACFLKGPRTLAGALTPLVGPAPTNYNFTSGDYNPATGLKGNGSTKRLGVGRTGNADPQDNSHCSVFLTEQFPNPSSSVYIGSRDASGAAGSTQIIDYTAGNNDVVRFISRGVSVDRSGLTDRLGFIGISRSTSASFQNRAIGVTATNAAVSSTPSTADYQVFSRVGFSLFTNNRFGWYSVGEAVNLELLDNRLSAYMTAIDTGTSVPYIAAPPRATGSGYDIDAKDYFMRVAAAGGDFASAGYTANFTKATINRWFVAMKDLGVYNNLVEVYLLVGPTFNGIFQKLKYLTVPTITNVNFVSGDYIQSGPGAGLRGNSSSKRLDTLLPTSNAPSSSHVVGVYVTVAHGSGGGRTVVGAVNGTRNAGMYGTAGQGIYASTGGTARMFENPTGMMVLSARSLWSNGVKGALQTGGTYTTGDDTYGLFGRAGSFSNPRMTFAAIGASYSESDVVKMSSATNALMGSLDANTYDTDTYMPTLTINFVNDRDAVEYFDRVTTAGGTFASTGYTSSTIRRHINAWFMATKDLGVYDKLVEVYLLSGPTFPGIFQKLKYLSTPALTNFNFVAGDYVQTGAGAGLKGNGSTKRLASQYSITGPQIGNLSFGAYSIDMPIVSTGHSYMGCRSSTSVVQLGPASGPHMHFGNPGRVNFVSPLSTGFQFGSSSVSTIRIFQNGVFNAAFGGAGTYTGTPNQWALFQNGNNSEFSTVRIRFAFVGTTLTDADAANLSAVTNDLMTKFEANVY